MNQAIRILSISALMLEIASPAANAAILTVSALSTQAVGVGEWTGMDSSGVATDEYSYLFGTQSFDVQTIATELDPAPTTTGAGIEKTYEIHETGYTATRTTGAYDYVTFSGSGTASASVGAKYVLASLTLRSTEDTKVSFSFRGDGAYTPVVTPFGTSAPGVTSVYAGPSINQIQALPTSFNVGGGQGGLYSAYGYAELDLAANVESSFVAALYAPNGLAISYFEVFLLTDDYNVAEENVREVTGTSRTLIDAKLVAPVPLPAGVWLAMSGLAALMMRRRRAV